MKNEKKSIMKRVFAFMVCFFLMAAGSALAEGPASGWPPAIIVGDADCDTVVALSDAVKIIEYILGKKTTPEMTLQVRANADISRNQIVDIQDALGIQRWLLKQTNELEESCTVSEADDIQFCLKIVSASSGTISVDGRAITFANAAEAKGAVLVIQEFIKAPATLRVQSAGSTFSVSDKAISLQNGVNYFASIGEEKNYTLNGINGDTAQFVSCFSRFGRNMVINGRESVTLWGHSNDYFWEYTGPDQLSIIWISSADKNGNFFSQFTNGQSDAFPFSQFEAKVGNEITDGTYTVDILDSFEHPDNGTQQNTYLFTPDQEKLLVTRHSGITIQIGGQASYAVTLHPNGGTINEGKDVTTYTAGTGAALPGANDISRDGYTFGGWFDNQGLTGSAVTAISATDTGEKEYWAKWTADPATAPVFTTQPQSVTLELNAAGGNVLTVETESISGHTVKYQWYVNTADSNAGGTAISGANSPSYAAPADKLGTKYYYCVATAKRNDNDQTAEAKSDPAAVTVEKPKVSLIVKATDQPMNSIQSSPAFAETDGLLNGHTLSAVTITFDPPSGRLLPSGAVIKDGVGKNVTDQYSISYAPGVATGDDRIIFTVRFKVNHGKWNDGRSADKVVKLSRRKDEDLLLRLSEEDIPTAGNLPDPGYSEGMWEAEPSDRYAVSDSMTFIYNYIQLPPAQITRVPSKNEFSYDSDEHPLLKSNGTASGGALQYACGTILAPTESWSSAIPTGLEAGIYYVWVKAAGDADHSDSAAQRVKVEVWQAWLDLQAASGTWVYDGLPHTAPGVSVMTGTQLYGEDRLVASATGSVTNVSDTAENNNPIADEIRIMRGEKDVTQSYSVWYKLPGKLTITARPVTVTAKDQEVREGESIQTGTQWVTLTGAVEGHALSDVTLAESGGVITPSQAKIQDAAGQDVTKNYAFTYVSAASASYSYGVVSGDGQTWHKNSNKLLSFTVKRSLGDEAAFGNFDHAEADGAALTAAQAETEQGSLILRLKPGYLETLSLGSHTVKFIFRDGTAEAAFTVRPVEGSFEDVAVPSDTFTFKKIWQGDSEKSIDFTLYKLGGEVYRHGFDKKVVSKREWRYSAWLSSPAACYVVEQPVKGYITKYENVGVYAGITDRCCDGGTIINKKLPKTGDETPLLLWAGMALLGAAGVGAALILGRRRKAHK